jgi:hypothetical protein
MEKLKKLKKKTLEDLEEFADKGELNLGDYTTISMLTDIVKDIEEICMKMEGHYSQAPYGDGRMMPYYNQVGHSYTDGGYSQKRDSRGRYSRAAEDKNRIIRDIEKMTEQFSDEEWDMLEGFVHRIREAS